MHARTHTRTREASLERLGLQTVLNIPANESLRVGAERLFFFFSFSSTSHELS